jgi:hypothetical protein
MLDFEFRPAAVTIQVGDTVTWFNQGPTVHTATSDQRGAFDTDLLSAGRSASITFRTAGTFSYFCAVHPDMRGTVTVVGAAATATPSVGGSPTPRATAPPASTTGGREFTLRVGAGGLATLSWTTGTAQTGYALLRIGAGGVAPIPLGALAARHEDAAGSTEGFSCYLLVPLQGDRVLGLSDLLCAIRRIASGNAPGDVAIRMEGPQLARLSWAGAQGADGYLVLPLPQGAPSVVGGGVTTAVYPVNSTTCFLLIATQRGGAVGNSDGVCAVPGVGTLR